MARTQMIGLRNTFCIRNLRNTLGSLFSFSSSSPFTFGSSGSPTDFGVSLSVAMMNSTPKAEMAAGTQKQSCHLVIYPQMTATTKAPMECEVFQILILVASS